MNKFNEKQLATACCGTGQKCRPERICSSWPNWLASASPLVRRLAASAIGKLAGIVPAGPAVRGAASAVAGRTSAGTTILGQGFGGVRLCGEGRLCRICVIFTAIPWRRDYVKRSVLAAGKLIRSAVDIEAKKAVHTCQRCGVKLEADEYVRSHKAFQRPFCNYCFDEVFLERRNFETKVELQKNIRAKDGTWVQSDGERLICEVLTAEGIRYRYDERFRILDGYAIRPDFYLPEFDVYIEYWGMDTADYKIGMLKKQQLYQQQGKRLISLYPADKPRLRERLLEKLAQVPLTCSACAAQCRHPETRVQSSI